MRQAGLVDRKKLQDEKVTLIGAGGIGSVTAAYLVKMGVKNLVVYDFDEVEIHNIPNQMYPKDAVGKPKVEALKEYLEFMEGVTIEPRAEEFTKDSNAHGIVVSAVDSMAARKNIWSGVVLNPDVEYFIDGRMGGWVCHRIAIDMMSDGDARYYDTTLFDDDDAQPLPCTERAIIFNTGAIASMIANTIVKKVQDYTIKRHLVYDMRNSVMMDINE